MDEHFNQTIVNMISKYAQEQKETWDDLLGETVYIYNTAVQESTKYTPFEVMFGRRGKLPIDFNTMNVYDPNKKLEEFFQLNMFQGVHFCWKIHSEENIFVGEQISYDRSTQSADCVMLNKV